MNWDDGLSAYSPFSLFHDPHGGLPEVLTCFFPLILRRTVGRLLFELIGLSLCLIGFCSFL